jgi:hypothetical protein
MTLSDAGLYFKMVCWVIGFALAARVFWPTIKEGLEQRRADREKEEFNAYLDRIDPDYERFVHGNGTKVPLRDVERDDSIDPWKRY